jgi:histidine triad (HIT) family protein
MSDFYCEEALSGRTPVERVLETANVLAFRHTRPYWPEHIVVIPKRHIGSLLELGPDDAPLVMEMVDVLQRVATEVTNACGACRVLTNLGDYQDSKHLHWHVSWGEPLR